MQSTSELASTIRSLLKRTKAVEDIREDASRLDELRRLFGKLAANGDLDVIADVPGDGRGGSGRVITRDGGSSEKNVYDGDKRGTTQAKKEEDRKHEARCKWNSWLRLQHELFLKQLCERISAGEGGRRRYALRTYCGVVANTPKRNGTVPVSIADTSRSSLRSSAMSSSLPVDDVAFEARIDERLVRRMIDALCRRRHPRNSGRGEGKPPQWHNPPREMDDAMLKLFATEFLRPFWDARYFTLLAVRDLALEYARPPYHHEEDDDRKGEHGTKDIACMGDNLLRILEAMPILTVREEEIAEGSFLFRPSSPVKGMTDRSVGIGDDEDSCSSDEEETEVDGSDKEENSDEEPDYIVGNKKHKRPEKNNSSRKRQKKERDTRSPILRLNKHRRVLEEAWLSVLRLPHLSHQTHKRALQALPTYVIPHIHHKLRLADYLTRSYNNGGIVSLLALDGLFTLMTRHGLEYPQFYASLYSLVKPRVFYARHRAKFFRLLAKCLSVSQMLPAYVVAAFCKRLCRCALSSPPSGALFVLALVSNLLRRHSACGCLVHRGGSSCDEKSTIEDVYDAETDSPYESRALESSLWELTALEKHYHPAVSALAKACGREDDRTTPLHDVDQFLPHTYKSLFEQETKRRVNGKKVKASTPLTFTEPESLFVEGDVFRGFLTTP